MLNSPSYPNKPHAKVALAAMLLLLGVLSGCSTYRTSPGPSIADTSAKGGLSAFEVAAETFATDLKASAAAVPSDTTDLKASAAVAPSDTPEKKLSETTAAQKAFKSGLAMLDLQCNRYLDAIGGANQAAANERKQVSLVGGFTSAIMGLTGSSAKQIAGIATSFSFASSSMDAFTTAYLFSDAASSVTKIVRESQTAWLTALSEANSLNGLDYSGAVALLVRYESLCRPAQIRALIDQSIAKGTVIAVTTRSSDLEVTAVLVTLNVALKRPVTEAEAINLYAWYKYPSERLSGPKLSSDEPIASFLKSGMSVEELEKRLAQAFLPISIAGSPVPARWEAGVQMLRKVTAPSASAAPAAIGAPASVEAPVPSRPAAVPLIQLRIPSLTIK